jgi:hypothetical protein
MDEVGSIRAVSVVTKYSTKEKFTAAAFPPPLLLVDIVQ